MVIDALATPTIGDPFARNGPGVVIELPVLALRGAWAYGVVMLATANVEPKRVKNWISVLRPGWYILRAGITAILAKHASWAASCFGGSYPALVPKACILGSILLGETHENCFCLTCISKWANNAVGEKQI